MIDAKRENVVVLREFERARKGLSPIETSVLVDSRDLALSRLTRSLSAMMDKAVDELFSLADKAAYHNVQNLYLEAMGQARDKRAEIEAEFKLQFTSIFDKEVKGGAGAQQSASSSNSQEMELSLVEPDDLEESLAVGDIANKLRDNCGKELFALDKRMGVLLHDPELDYLNNPLSPEVIGNAFMAAMQILAVEVKVKLIFVTLFNKYMADAVQSMYQDVNQHLVDKGVLPKIRVGLKKRQENSGSGEGNGTAQGPGAGFNAPAGAGTGNANPGVFAALQQLLGFHNTAHGALPQTGLPATNNASVLNDLTRLQHGNLSAGSGAGSVLNTSVMMAGSTNVLRDIKTTEMASRMGQMDAMTLDIVAMLFDYILDDRHIPDSMKALIARLQIPVLKVAMLDKAFFSQRAHPARKLLDTLASVAIGLDEDHDEALYTKVEGLVQRILNEFDDNVGIFAELLEEFEAFLIEEKSKADDLTVRSAKTIYAQEQIEIAAVMAQDEIQRRMHDRPIPKVIRTFLLDYWTTVLRTAYVKHGEDSEAWSSSLGMVEDLIWSAEPKRNTDDRKELVGLLPGLLKRLQQGMDQISMPTAERDEFFTQLVRCHAAAVKAGLQSGGAAEAANADLETEELSAPSISALTESASDFVPIEPVDDALIADADFTNAVILNQDADHEELRIVESHTDTLWQIEDGDEFDTITRHLQRGTWVAFEQEDGTTARSKLAWVSPLKGVFLFTNRLGLKAASITPDALAAKFRSGTAQLIDGSPLVDRAVNNLMHDLSKGALQYS